MNRILTGTACPSYLMGQWLLLAMLVALSACAAQGVRDAERAGLVMSPAGIERIRANLGKVPLFDATLQQVKAEVDADMAAGIDVPVPKDFSGGYTHQRHKRNWQMLQKAGALFQILGDERYAIYVRDMLLQYEAMYKDLPLHPQTRSYARGKLFWQCLNDSNWLVYVSQAYDSIYSWLPEQERERLEQNLFRPFADFISVENPQFFNRVHNHSTWGNAAVGMIGLVMRDDELVQRALYGIENDGLEPGKKDNDGGFIKVAGQKAGFMANLEAPFSPDGYYTEGPYYQRYAMFPFLAFAQALNNVKPELKIFEHQDGVLLKAVGALLNLADSEGKFFPLNDAQKGMSTAAGSLISAVDIAYYVGGEDPQLLSVAEQQGRVLLDDAGFAVAKAIRDGKAKAFALGSAKFSDGSDGNEGGLAILRDSNTELALVYKYTAQGLSHGHYDKLSFSMYEGGNEVLQDYGMVRFVNVEQKGGGNYLPENGSWAKQSIAHNTLTVNEASHFQGDYETGSKHHSELAFFNANNPALQVVSANDSNAYPGVAMQRTLALLQHENFEKPVVLDIFKANSASTNQYDLPYYFFGQLIDTNFDYQAKAPPTVLGEANGYQHLYLEAAGEPSSSSSNNSKVTWLNDHRFYTLTTLTKANDALMFTRIGANDPDYNLRRDAAFMLRRENSKSTLFVSAIESHGSYNPVSESAANAKSSIETLTLLHNDEQYTAVSLLDRKGKEHILIVVNADAEAPGERRLELDGRAYTWSGGYYYEVLSGRN